MTLDLTDDLSKKIEHLFYTTPSFVQHFKAMGELKLELQSGNTQLKNRWFFVLFDLSIWQMSPETEQSGTKPNLVAKILATNFGVFFKYM